MAIQKKSIKATAQKSKTSGVASRKPVSKTSSKAKPAVPKGKAPVKAVSVSKKAAPAKSKTPVKPVAKTVGKKPVMAKSSSNGATKAVMSKGKTAAAKTVARVELKKPIAKSQAPIKSQPASKNTGSSKKVTTVAKTVSPPKASASKKQNSIKAPVKPIAKAQVKNAPAAKAPQVAMKKVVTKPIPVESKKTQLKESIKSPIKTQVPEKKNGLSGGSKMSDVATRPSVSPKTVSDKPSVAVKAKESSPTLTKQPNIQPVKPQEKMAERKENKPVMVASIAEEPQKTRYNDRELEEFDLLIDQKLVVAREQLEFYLKQLEDMAENPDNKIKGLDDGLSSLESERISSMASRQQKLIQHLENAKIRIKNKVYGICRETGKLISKERLRAVPHATLSIEAKQAQN